MGLLQKLFKKAVVEKTQKVIDIEILSQLWVSSSNRSQPREFVSVPTSCQAMSKPAIPVLSVYDALRDIIDPVEKLIKTKGAWDGLLKVFEVVERYGSYPSVVLTKDSAEYRDDVLDILSKVTIKEHSIRVTRIMINEIKNNFSSVEGFVLISVLAGLMHDIGKADPLRTSPQYSKYDHPKIGADLLRSCFVQDEFGVLDIYEVNKAIEIILNHHKASNEQLISIFQMADERARVDELKCAHKVVVALEERLSVGDILRLIEPHINAAKAENDWNVFSHKDVVYVNPEFLYDIILKYSEENNILFSGQIRNLSKDYFIKNIVKMFRDSGILAPIKLTHEKGSWFRVQAADIQLRPFFLIPLKVTAFDLMPSELEERKKTLSKNPLLKLIHSVVLSGGPR